MADNSPSAERHHTGAAATTATTTAHHPPPAPTYQHHHPPPKVKTILSLEMGRYEVDTWYYSPYPAEYQSSSLYVCERCFKYMKTRDALHAHCAVCNLWHPPGDEIYRHNTEPLVASTTNPPTATTSSESYLAPDGRRALSLFEVNGKKNPVYCQNICLLAKLFLDHKTLCYDVASFYFYVLCEFDVASGYRVVGYFSKESPNTHTMSCLLVLPQHQKKRYGRLLISLAYLLARKTRFIGTPERPLSDLGYVSFLSYWTKAVCEELQATHPKGITIHDLCHRTCIRRGDVLVVLRNLGLVTASAIDAHDVCVNGGATEAKNDGVNDRDLIAAKDVSLLRHHIEQHTHPLDIEVDVQNLRWRCALPPHNLR